MMPEPTVDGLRDLSREELIALLQRLFEEIRRLEAEIERLKPPAPTSRNSSQPPSRDWKVDRPQRRRRKKVGAKPGHPKAERALVAIPIALMFVLGLWPRLVLDVINPTVVRMVEQLKF